MTSTEKNSAPRLLIKIEDSAKLTALQSLVHTCGVNKQVRIITSDSEACKALKQNLFSETCKPFYVDENAAPATRFANVLIAGRNQVGSVAFDLQSAEVVIFEDASLLLSDSDPSLNIFNFDIFSKSPMAKAPFRLDLGLLFDPKHPTHIPANAIVFGFLGLSTHPSVAKRLTSFFPTSHLLDSDGKPKPRPKIHLVDFNHGKPSSPPTALAPSTFAIKKASIWQNPARNRFIAELLMWLQGRSKLFASLKPSKLLTRVQKKLKHRHFAVICDNIDQKTGIVSEYLNLHSRDVSTKETPVDFVTMPSEGSQNLQSYDLIIRVDAGCGSIANFILGENQVIVDVADSKLPGFHQQIQKRLRSYKQGGFRVKGNIKHYGRKRA